MKGFLIGICTLLLVCAFASGFAWAQATAQISGTAKDASGAVLPGVEVTATQTDTGIARSTVTNETGSYVLPNLLIGPYRLEAGLPGFRTFVQTGIVLQVGTSPVINPVLQVGQVTEQVEVQANATQVETRSVGVGNVFETQRLLELPLNGRNVTDLIPASGAAVQTDSSRGFGMRTGVKISVGGGNTDGVQYTLDGAPHINPMDGTSMPLPFPDALQEFKFSTSTQDASNGMRSGAVVSAVIKSGSNAYHGDLFEFVRNYVFNGRDAFATTNDGLKRNQFGGVIGGPIKKDKMFFFTAYQGTLIRQAPVATTVFVPTPQMFAGDFTAFASPACQNGRQVTLRGPFVNNRVDPGLFSPAALKIAAKLPKAFDACGTYLTGNTVHENDHQLPVRVDLQVNSKETLFGRYLMTKQTVAIPYNLTPQDVLTSSGYGSDDLAHSLTIGDTYVINPNIVNSFRVSGNRIRALKPGASVFGAPDVGINAYTYTPKYMTLPVAGAFSLTGQGSFSANSFFYTTTFGANDDVSILKGSHQFAFGANFMRTVEWSIAQAFSGGFYNINGAVTGLGMSDFFLGNVALLRQANPNPLNLNQNFFGAYAQDTWKVTPRLTLNYGVNWQPFLAMSFPQGDVYNFNLAGFYAGKKSTVIPNAPAGFSYPGDPRFNGKSGIQSRYGNVDPRVGLAWDVSGDGKTAIRVGGGIAHDFIEQDLHLNTSSVSPFRLTVNFPGVSLDNPWATYPGGNPFPYNFNRQKPTFAPYGSYLPVPPDMKTHVQYTWNFAIQRQMTPDLFVSASYIGTHVAHIWNAIELNPGLFLGLGPCTINTLTGPVSYPQCTNAGNVNQRRLLNLANPQASMGNITQYDDGGTQGYNGMLLDMRWRHGRNLNLDANYTWSHCIGLPMQTLLNPGQNYVHQAYQNNGPANRNLDIGDCGADRRQIFNTTFVASTPAFSNKTVRALASGLTFSTSFRANSGRPLTVYLGTDAAMNGFLYNNNSLQRPNQVLANPYGNRSSNTNYLNAAAFAVPAPGTYGNVGQNSIVGPRYWDWSQAVSRQFRIREDQRIELRAEAFNVTNSFRPGNPSTVLTNPNTFGRILCSASGNTGEGNVGTGCVQPGQTGGTPTIGGPRILQFAVKYVF
jgi:hypothetical protein